MNAPFETLRLERPEPGILLLTLNRPHRANALNTAMAQDLQACYAGFAEEPDLRCLLLTGAGERAFCAGADLKERRGMSVDDWHAQHGAFEAAVTALTTCALPTIAVVNGAAFGGGLELVLACDFAFAAATARFGFPEVTLGIMPGLGGTQRLPRAVGLRRARQILLTGTPFSAQEARDWGVINEIHEPEDLLPSALGAARHIAANAPLAVRNLRSALAAVAETGLQAGLGTELTLYQALIPTPDREEGIAAFHEGRKPHFTGASRKSPP